MPSTISEEYADELATMCRTALGDTLRAVIHFTPDDFDLVYLRTDLYSGDENRAREVRAPFIETERLGFTSNETYAELAEEFELAGIGEYVSTVRIFTEGYVSRVIEGDHGVVVTTDAMDIVAFEELAISLRRLLAEAPR
jgi:hypothetical protein